MNKAETKLVANAVKSSVWGAPMVIAGVLLCMTIIGFPIGVWLMIQGANIISEPLWEDNLARAKEQVEAHLWDDPDLEDEEDVPWEL